MPSRVHFAEDAEREIEDRYRFIASATAPRRQGTS